MDATSRLVEVADALAEVELEAILIGGAGAALHGEPTTMASLEFLYRRAAAHDLRLRRLTEKLGGVMTQPVTGVSTAYRIWREEPQLQVDLVSRRKGTKSFDDVRGRAVTMLVGGRMIWVAALVDIRRSERERTLEAMREASDRELTEMIRRQLALPMHKRTNFLRLRLPNGGSCL